MDYKKEKKQGLKKVKNAVTAIALTFFATTVLAEDLTLSSEESKPYAAECAQQVVWVIGDSKNYVLATGFRTVSKDNAISIGSSGVAAEEVENVVYNTAKAVVNTNTSTVKVRVETFGDYTKKGNGWTEDKTVRVTQGMFECTYVNAVKGQEPSEPDYVASMYNNKVFSYYTVVANKQQCIQLNNTPFGRLHCALGHDIGAFPDLNKTYDTDAVPYRYTN